MTSTEMQNITQGSLRQFLEDNLSLLYGDASELAMMNRLPITFDFTSEALDWWRQSVTFTPDEYESVFSRDMES